MFCRNCGAENDAESKFCKSCGQPLIAEQSADVNQSQTSSSSQTASPSQTASSSQTASPSQTASQNNQQNTQNTQNANAGQDRSMYKYNYNSGDSDATVALIMGVVSIVMCSSSILGIGLGILAIIMAGKAKKQGSTSGNIAAGQICGIIGICLSSIATLYYIFAFILGFARAFH